MKKTFLLLSLFLGIAYANATDYYAQYRTDWAQKAEQYKPTLNETVIRPQSIVEFVKDEKAFQGWKANIIGEAKPFFGQSFKNQKEIILDLGDHYTGYFYFKLKEIQGIQDAPVRIKFTFGETAPELSTPYEPFNGGLSRAWMQDEIVTICEINDYETINRRLACRYIKIELMGSSPYFDFTFDDLYFKAVSSAKESEYVYDPNLSKELNDINRISLRTLHECMQTVFEDGPKRDKRLWVGDLYLTNLANNYSYQNYDLAKRCFYLLASLADENGRLHANVFEAPKPHPQYGTYIIDYNLLYNVALLDYYKATNDIETIRDLWPVAKRQIEDAMQFLNDKKIYDREKSAGLWLFFDWKNELDRYVAMQGVTIFSLQKTYELAQILGKTDEVKNYPTYINEMKSAAKKYFYDKNQKLFISNGQISYISQVWMVLSETVKGKEAGELLNRVMNTPNAVTIGSPYGYHYLIEATIKVGMKSKAEELLINYWGKMVEYGADTFWEVYDPYNQYTSPYDFFPLNSACHAWSSTPVYFINKYFK